jgi:quercetin dioxygenase-like cupin family protein
MPDSTSPEPVQSLNLLATARELCAEKAYERDGHAARTLVRAGDIRVVIVAMRRGSIIQEHRARATGSLQALTGLLRVRLEERQVDLVAGQLLVLDANAQHEVTALDESVFLLTLGRHDPA